MGSPRRKYLKPEEVAEEWHEYFDFTNQQVFPRANNRRSDLYIRVICPLCGQERWRTVSSQRRFALTPRCHPCSISGAQNSNWAGKQMMDPRGYALLRLCLLAPSDHALAVAMVGSYSYVREHRLVMAHHLGRPLTKDEIVHHRNGIKNDNRLPNLRLLTRQTHTSAWGDPYYQKWQESLAENVRLKEQLRAIQEE